MIREFPTVPDGFSVIREVNGSILGRTVVAERLETAQKCVIKIVPRAHLGSYEQASAFLDTVRKSMDVKCKFLVPYSDLVETPETIYLVRRYVTGVSLSEDVENGYTSDLNSYVVIWKILLRSFQLLHQCGVAPNFLRPCNVFLDTNREPVVVDIYPPIYDMCQKMQNPMNFCFLAPEVFTNEYGKPEASDVWSLVVLFIYMVTGQIPWNTQNAFKMLRQIMDGHTGICIRIPDELRSIVSKTLLPEQSARESIDWLKEQSISVANIDRGHGTGRKLRKVGFPQRSAILRVQPMANGVASDRRRSLASFVHKSTVWSQQRFS